MEKSTTRFSSRMTGTKEALITAKNELTLRKSIIGSTNSKKEMESSRK
jgi:hypothetical protein